VVPDNCNYKAVISEKVTQLTVTVTEKCPATVIITITGKSPTINSNIVVVN
jgi:hypothetical protein